jgi:hypothetical protein
MIHCDLLLLEVPPIFLIHKDQIQIIFHAKLVVYVSGSAHKVSRTASLEWIHLQNLELGMQKTHP